MARSTIRSIAREDIVAIIDAIAMENLDAARHFVTVLHEEIELLTQHPGFGALLYRPPARLRGVRRWPMKHFRKYLIFYLSTGSGIEVIRVLHGARRISKALRETG